MTEIKQAMLKVFQDPLYKDMPIKLQVEFNNAILMMEELEKVLPVLAVKANIFDHLSQASGNVKSEHVTRSEGRWLIRESERYSDAANS